jgi:hypothetical protein
VSYFKYDDGNAFLLNGVPYTGFFNVDSDGMVYTGKSKNAISEILTPTGTYISDFYMNRLEFDNTFKNIDDISYKYPSKLDVLDKNGMNMIFENLNLNNLLIFKSLTIRNKQIINFQNSDSHFYGLSSNSTDIYGKDIPYGKSDMIHIDPFSYEPEWAYLDSIKVGTILVDVDNNFKYLASTGTDIITLSGSFTNKTPLTLVKYEQIPQPDLIYQISHDEEDDKIFIVQKDEIFVYEASNYINCGELILIDKIPLIPTEVDIYKWLSHVKWKDAKTRWSQRYVFNNKNNPEFIKFGKNVRTGVEGNNLRIYNKFTNDLLGEYEILGTPLSLAIRNVDDMIAVLIKNDDIFSIYYIDPVNDTATFQNIEEFSNFENVNIKFSNFDSNIIYTSNIKQIQMRNITNSAYPFAFLTEDNLLYPENLKWGEAYSQFKSIKRKWNTKSIKSNNLNNLVFDNQNVGSEYHLFLHNIGRIYALKQPIANLNRGNLPFSLKKTYNGVLTSETSFGAYLNINLQKIVEDLMTLYQKASRSYTYTKNDVTDVTIKSIQIDVENFYMQGNETFNALSIQRIIKNISDMQKTLISKSITLNN